MFGNALLALITCPDLDMAMQRREYYTNNDKDLYIFLFNAVIYSKISASNSLLQFTNTVNHDI